MSKDMISTILAGGVSLILIIRTLRFVYVRLYKKYISSSDNKAEKAEKKSLLKGLMLALIIYTGGFYCTAIGASSAIKSGKVEVYETLLFTAASLIITLGLGLAIYSIQALESTNVIGIIEKRIDKKLKDITKDDIKELILKAASQQIARNIDPEQIQAEIINQVSSTLIDRNTK